MIEISNKKKCCGCYACYNICPERAIKMQEDDKGFKYPDVDKEKCIECGLCEKVCPIIVNKKVENKPISYACFCKDDNIRENSSSGGIFTILATEVIKDNGVVFGAGFDEDFNVRHIMVENLKDLGKLRGSKYVQSDIKGTYKKAKENLEMGKKVLFTGTPCQIEGLKTFLQKNYKNLYTQDIICHGVPSPKVWREYKKLREKIDKQRPQEINFRNKDNGWKYFNLKFQYEKGKSYKKNQCNDLYMKIFLQDLSLRDSCYSCSFKKYNRNSDITLADFWGIKNVIPDIDDNKGISLVIVNSKKGQEMINNIKDKIMYKEVDLNIALKYNQNMIKSVKENNNREKFFHNLGKKDLDKVANRYLRNTNILVKLLKKFKTILFRQG